MSLLYFPVILVKCKTSACYFNNFLKNKTVTKQNKIKNVQNEKRDITKNVKRFSERELTFTFAICYRTPVRLSVCRLSVCNVRARCTLLSRLKFSAIFFALWYLGHPLTSKENFTEIVLGEPLRQRV